jgi:iduronate 2-sulfatase
MNLSKHAGRTPFLVSATFAAMAATAAPPNVLLICVDDLKPTLGAFGDATARTPNIDRLAGRGTAFRCAYTQQGVCAPSRNSLLTGLRPDQIGIYTLGDSFRLGAPDAITLPQSFLRAGYSAESLGKVYHVGHGNGDDARSWSRPYWWPQVDDARLAAADGPKPPAGAALRKLKPGDKALPTPWGWPDVPDATLPDGKTADRAVERLEALADGGKPFFLALGFLKPHLPFIAPKRYWDLYDPAALPVYPPDATLPKDAPAFAGHSFGELRQYSDIQAVGPLTPDQARTMVHGYYAAVSFTDAQVGRVLDALDRRGLWTNTVVVLWGDHGWHLGDHGLWCKHTNYEQAARQPVIVAAPGFQPGVCDALVATVDLYPTLCALAGVAAPQGLAGRSLVPLLSDPSATVQDAVFHVFPRRVAGREMLGRAVRTARYRYVEWRAVDNGEVLGSELYDYEADPDETANLASRPERRELVETLAARIAALGPARPPVAKPR